jgi:hypothetical protein
MQFQTDPHCIVDVLYIKTFMPEMFGDRHQKHFSVDGQGGQQLGQY